MTQLLTRLFVKDRENLRSPTVRRAYGTLASVVGILLNLLLFVGKYAVGTLFLSVAIRADAFNNLSDAGSQIVSLVSFRIAAKPADREHPYGHARIEYMASMIVSLLILLIGYELFSESLSKFLAPLTERTFEWVTAVVLAVSILAKVWLALFNRSLAKKLDSSVMRATASDSLSDAAATGVVLLSSVVSAFVKLPFDLDAVMGIAVSVLVFLAGLKVLGEAKNAILGEAPADDVIEEIRAIVGRYPDAIGIHDMAVHNYGPGKIYVSLHVEVDGKKDIYVSHDMVDNIERDLREAGFEATIHMDPIETDNALVTALRGQVVALMKSLDERLQIHDFRFVAGETHTNLIFDLMVPFEMPGTDEEVRELATTKIKEALPRYYAVISIDRG